MWSALKIAMRAAIWRRTPDPRLVGLPSLIGWILVLAAVRCALQLAGALPTPGFDPYGLNALVAWIAIALVITALFVPQPGRVTAVAAVAALSVLTEVVLGIAPLAIPLIQSSLPLDEAAANYPALNELWTSIGAPVAMFLLPAVAWIGAMFAILRSFDTQATLRVAGKVLALWAALFLAKNALPHSPVFAGPNFDPRNANLWEYVRARQLADVDRGRASEERDAAGPGLKLGAARTGQSQPALLKTALDQLAPQQPGKTDVYAIGLAGWAEQDVFIKELDGAFASLGRVLPLRDHTIRLSNYPETYGSLPVANRENFAAAVRAVAQVMDKEEDILLLLMTSHGATNGVGLQLPGGGQAILTPSEVAAILAKEGIKHRMVIVSACYGGVFVPPLANDDTIVLTAADDKNTSFGCAPGRDWTYFGDALFNQALQPGVDLKFAFTRARMMIAGWEQMDGVTPSNPQGHFGPALVDKLAPVLEAMQTASR